MKTKYVSIEDCIFIHKDIIKETGGRSGTRDFALLHSALSRLQASFGGNDLYPTLFEKAAALIHSLLLNHPFSDGNKRTSLAVCERFLEINKIAVNASRKERVQFTMAIEDKTIDLQVASSWLKRHSRKMKG